MATRIVRFHDRLRASPGPLCSTNRSSARLSRQTPPTSPLEPACSLCGGSRSRERRTSEDGGAVASVAEACTGSSASTYSSSLPSTDVPPSLTDPQLHYASVSFDLGMADFSIGDDGEQDNSSHIDVPDESEAILLKKRAIVREAHECFLTTFGSSHLDELRVAVAPGRVNLIGDHVDYCDGFVLPMAIPLYTVAIGRAADPTRGYSLIHSVHYNETVKLRIPVSKGKDEYAQWVRYVQGVLALLSETLGEETPCVDLLVHSHIQPGSSLSSSAALEVSVLFFLLQLVESTDRLSSRECALLCQRAENEYAGVPCGIMDQMVIVAAKNERALKIDCLSLEYESIPMSIAHDVVFLVTNSGVRHALASSEYANRRSTVEKAARLIGVHSWRDVNEEMLMERSASLTGDKDAFILDRATHVVKESARTVQAANALLDNNIILFGKLMTDSHESLRKKFVVSCAELDELVDIALSVEGVFGARMTGGGFGGCTVSMVRRDCVDTLKEEITRRYTVAPPSFFVCEPVGGVTSFSLDFLDSPTLPLP